MPLSKSEAAAIRKLRNRRERKVTQRFVIEGVRAVREALDGGLGMHRAIVSPRLEAVSGGAELKRAIQSRQVPLSEVSDSVLKGLSDTDTPQGVLVVGAEPAIPLAALQPDRGVLVLDGIQDPGNVGTLIRTAHAFNCGGAVALEGTADPWGAKAVRASAGSLFHLPVARASTTDFLKWTRGKESVQLLAASPGGGSAEPQTAPWALVVGSEGAGVSQPLLQAAHQTVAIAMPGGAESLNAAVAGSLLLHQLTSATRSLPSEKSSR